MVGMTAGAQLRDEGAETDSGQVDIFLTDPRALDPFVQAFDGSGSNYAEG